MISTLLTIVLIIVISKMAMVIVAVAAIFIAILLFDMVNGVVEHAPMIIRQR